MKKFLPIFTAIFFLMAICFISQPLAAQITHSESFDTTVFVPPGWTLVSGTLWSRQTTGSNPYIAVPHSGAGMARFSSHTGTLGSTATIATPVIDYSAVGVDTPIVSLWIFRDDSSLYLN